MEILVEFYYAMQEYVYTKEIQGSKKETLACYRRA
jgi:hypothetical protein